jgi:ferrochelatase
MSRSAVVIFNLGGPDNPDAIEPFLFNLFNDPAIIGLPGLLRKPLAKFIAHRRAPVARKIFAHLGGRSPLLEETEVQADALAQEITREMGREDESRVFIAMRYWHPFIETAVEQVQAFDPDKIVLLPLYPQYSTTTTASSLKEWCRAAAAIDLEAPTRAVCCYPVEEGYITGLVGMIAPAIEEARRQAASRAEPRVLFSAHGLPKKIIATGDPYQWQIEQTAAATARVLALSGPDWTVCYQSRVGPLQWIGPSLDDELARAAGDGVPVVVVPVAFVSEHTETLVELDIEYRKMARDLGVPAYVRVPAIGVDKSFISALARIAVEALKGGQEIHSAADGRACPAATGRCPLSPTGA